MNQFNPRRGRKPDGYEGRAEARAAGEFMALIDSSGAVQVRDR